MSIQVALYHKTEYRYDKPVTLLPQIVRLRPAPHCRTPILSYSLRVKPAEHFLNWQQDSYSNYQARLAFPKPTRQFQIEVDLLAEMVSINPFDFFLEPEAEQFPFPYGGIQTAELHPYLEIKEEGPRLLDYLKAFRGPTMKTVDFLVEVNQSLLKDISYVVRMEPGIQTCEETLTLGRGSCRDTAWLLVQLLRHLGLATRFVSGYLIQLAPDVSPLEGPPGPERDFTDLHAWAEVYLPGAGWVGLDPTSGLLAGEGHIPLACTADPGNAAPVTGTFRWDKDNEHDELGTHFCFAMKVQRLVEKPRVTKPFSREQWQAVDQLGWAIDEDLAKMDVRLTVGGEPTFVASNDRDQPEWNTAALGPTKRRRADFLLRRLRDRLAPGALLHFGQGKWYPGESLPRWALGCYWRRDGLPVWNNPELVAEEDKDYGYKAEDARAFLHLLAQRLGISPQYSIPGFEDIFYYLWREGSLPVNVDPRDSKLENPEERARLTRLLDQGLNQVVGYALPLRKEALPQGPGLVDKEERAWVSGRWQLRREHLFLIPGDSPMGYRLPLDSLPWSKKEEKHQEIPVDPWQERAPLPTKAEINQRFLKLPSPKNASQANGFFSDQVIHTALCVEPRQGKLFVFMPPLSQTEDYLELIAAIEATARTLHMPVMVEGYPPEFDPRLVYFKITPDPGVLEVNVHPSSSWPELVEQTTTIYEEAARAHLTTEKFMLDGRHVGTGGGNHITLGGQTPADSPLLRRPDLLRSLLGFWHNHPSLSYLFSGLFVGPTSQAPRVDEARNDSLHELEIAFQQISANDPCPPWLVDRAFRHLLTDVTGNTHRTEWCIDKLYSPDTSSGRLGIVEFRGFEMPPHPHMSLTQHLLLRALISWLWKEPYQRKLVRWGTELHDRFLLPHFVQADFRDVLEEIRGQAWDLSPEWFASHFEFRFPFLGQITRSGITLELRQAIEPWHVLGEETGAGGTVRLVDSSLERLQVKVRGFIPDRYVITCNGRKVPLHPTGIKGELVAGVRYRAWQPPSCLHPTIPVHAPLTFDIYDAWLQRSVGGCTYHVAHPGGRHFETFPVNANEAEGRRVARFFAFGHSPGTRPMPPDELNPEFPFTLDLRRGINFPTSAPPFGEGEGMLREAGYSTKINGITKLEVSHAELMGTS